MSDTPQPAGQREVLSALRDGPRAWGELRALTGLNDERLGSTIGELLDLRQVWTVARGDARLYGIERRTGLAPRFAHPRRRAGDAPA